MNVNPLNPMGPMQGLDWSGNDLPPQPMNLANSPPQSPPATSPGQPMPRPAAQPSAPQQQQAPAQAAPGSDAWLQQRIADLDSQIKQLSDVANKQTGVASQRAQEFQSSLNESPTAPAQESFNQQMPQPNAQEMMKSAPLLAVFAALGGKLTRMSGLTMIKATTGMIDGQIAGNQKAYQDAKATYDNEYQKFQDRQKQKLQVYKDQLEAWRDTYSGREKSWLIANAAVGDTINQAKSLQTNEVSILRAWAAMKGQEKKQQAAQQKQADDFKWFKAGEPAEANARKIEATLPRLEMADDTIKKIRDQLPALIADLKKALGPAASTPATIGDLIKKYGSDPRVGEFVARVNALKTALIGIEGSSNMRSNQFLQTIFSKTAPDLFNQPASQVAEATRIDAGMINSAYTKAKSELASQKQRVELSRSHVRGLSSREEPDEGGDVFSQADAIIGK